MSSSSLNGKTIRPGSLNGYSYYHSSRNSRANRQKPNQYQVKRGASSAPSSQRLPSWAIKVGLTAAVVVALLGVPLLRGSTEPVSTKASQAAQASSVGSQKPAEQSKAAVATPASEELTPQPAATTPCTGNTQSKLIKVSVSQRHLWGCEGEKLVHEGPVITGMLKHEETFTPAGTYEVYAKQTDTRLTGSDSAGSWNYPVSYWMPFLHNKHGTYGFHDATWRPDSDFGNIDPAGDNASHGCIELLKNDMQWLYEWAPTKTTLVVEN